jgi:hypothetical protein
MATVYKILVYDSTDEAAILAAGVSGAALFLGDGKGIAIGTAAFSDGILDGGQNHNYEGILNLGTHYPAGIVDGSNGYHAAGVYDGSIRSSSGILDETGTLRGFGIFSGYAYSEFGLYAGGFGNVINTTGILYYSSGTPTFAVNGIHSGAEGYTAVGILHSIDRIEPNGIFDGSTYQTTGIYDSATSSFYTDGVVVMGVWRGTYGIAAQGVGYQSTGIVSDISGTLTYASNGIFDGATRFEDGLFSSAGTRYSRGIYDGTNDGVYDGTTAYADGCWNNTTSTYYPIEALDVLGGGLA